VTFSDGSWGDGSRDHSGGMDSFGYGFFPANLTFTLGTAAARDFADLEVLLSFETGFLVVTVDA